MQGSSSTQPSGSSGPLLKGTPAFIPYFEKVVAGYKEAVSTALDVVAEQEEQSLQESARGSDTGWEDFADKLRVSYSHEDRDLLYRVETENDTESYKAQTLEYGDRMVPANALLRSSAAKARGTFRKRVTDEAHRIIVEGMQ